MPPPLSNLERFDALYREHHAAIKRFVHRRVDEAVVDDVVADIFAVAWRRLEDVPAEPLPWLYVTARNLIGAEHRSAAMKRARNEDLRRAATDEHESAKDPGDEIADRDLALAAFRELSERERETLRLVAWEGLDHATAAQVLGITRVAFSMRLSRARRRLHAAATELERAPRPTHHHPVPEKQV
ncbi:sigma-70 family RNA polymerase sigma factor [Patulibacter sp. NPDC049589]|uniref:RNA polymerase sigma factor n=1 Tax=Patulibacter sp. NPDC049589 TaxID=3154731 RepID=UPI00341FD373